MPYRETRKGLIITQVLLAYVKVTSAWDTWMTLKKKHENSIIQGYVRKADLLVTGVGKWKKWTS